MHSRHPCRGSGGDLALSFHGLRYRFTHGYTKASLPGRGEGRVGVEFREVELGLLAFAFHGFRCRFYPWLHQSVPTGTRMWFMLMHYGYAGLHYFTMHSVSLGIP